MGLRLGFGYWNKAVTCPQEVGKSVVTGNKSGPAHREGESKVGLQAKNFIKSPPTPPHPTGNRNDPRG